MTDNSTSSNTPDGTAQPLKSNIIAPKVTGLAPVIMDAVPKIISEWKARKHPDIAVFSAVRVPEDQEKLYALGRTVKNSDGFDEIKKPMGNIVTNAKAWESWHFYGLAIDFAFKNSKGSWYWPADDSPLWNELGTVGVMFGLQWGGNWTKFPDLPHFQHTGKIPNVREAKRILFEEGLDKLWKAAA